jgi:hypothetical protein
MQNWTFAGYLLFYWYKLKILTKVNSINTDILLGRREFKQ